MRRLLALAAASGVAAVLAAVATASFPDYDHRTTADTGGVSQKLAGEIALSRLATAKYATDLARAKQDGYSVLTRMIPDMGWHFVNPNVTGFHMNRPPILVYGRRGSSWQLVAYEWVFAQKPKTPPLPGASYGSFGAACHYRDGTFQFEQSQELCPARSPQTGAAFGSWHPDLVTLHVWAWYPNPNGVFAGMNPLMHAFNRS